MDDFAILELFREDPQKGTKKIFDTYWDKLYHYAYGILQSEDAAKDVVQSLFINMWENRENARNIRNLKYYLYQSVKNNALKYINNHRFTELHEEVIRELEYLDTSDQELIDKKQSEEVEKRLATLPKRRREIFLLSRYDQLSNEEIARKQGLSIRTVETHISNAIKSLEEHTVGLGCLLLSFFF